MTMRFFQACVVALGLFSATAGASPLDKVTDAELAVLPPYCMAKFRGVNVKYWEEALGSIYLHVHHYCTALYLGDRYYKTSNPENQKLLLREIDSNLDYMITHADHNSALMPKIYYTKGKFLVLDGKDAEAVNAFLDAIRLKPDYSAPYLGIADFYARMGKNQDALKLLQDGLRQVPSSRSLARRYQELGGKLPLPEVPIDQTAKAESHAPMPTESENTAETPASETPVEKIGSPTNPWCRFCTD